MNLDLTDEETATLLRELDGLIDGNRYFLSSESTTARASLSSATTSATVFPAKFSPSGQETGTYQVDSDCTGSDELDLNVPNSPPGSGVIKVLFVISDGGRHVHEVVSEFIPPFSSGPVPTQTSADAWKVADEEN
jgi:hypothetical protein